jgi:hypothetical protein
VGDLLAAARVVADGGHLEGYKGGIYKMDRDSPLWADEWGDYAGWFVSGLSLVDGKVVLHRVQAPDQY